MSKLHTRFHTETAQKPFPLERHIPMWHIRGAPRMDSCFVVWIKTAVNMYSTYLRVNWKGSKRHWGRFCDLLWDCAMLMSPNEEVLNAWIISLLFFFPFAFLFFFPYKTKQETPLMMYKAWTSKSGSQKKFPCLQGPTLNYCRLEGQQGKTPFARKQACSHGLLM